MKLIARHILLPALLISCASFCFAQDGKPQPKEIVTSRPSPEYLPGSWKEFSSDEGRFTILFPGVPAGSTHSIDSTYGKIEEHSFILKTFAYYGVAYSDFPEKDGIRDVKAFFTGFRVGYVRNTQAELLEEKDDYRFASPGRFIKTRIQGGYINRVRLYLIRNRFYVLSVVMPEENADARTRKFYEETAIKFLDSFKPKIPDGVKGERFGDPVGAKPLGLPAGAGISVDPALNNLSYSKDGVPEPETKVNGGILNGKALSLPKPVYPAEAKATGVSGEVTIKVVVDESGNVIWLKAVSGPALLLAVSEEAAARAKFSPLTVQGRNVKVMGFIIYKFVSH